MHPTFSITFKLINLTRPARAGFKIAEDGRAIIM
jgi:hypothetical protein